MYAQSHAVHWTQKYDKEEGLYEDFTHALLAYVERYKIIIRIHRINNSHSNSFIHSFIQTISIAPLQV